MLLVWEPHFENQWTGGTGKCGTGARVREKKRPEEGSGILCIQDLGGAREVDVTEAGHRQVLGSETYGERVAGRETSGMGEGWAEGSEEAKASEAP